MMKSSDLQQVVLDTAREVYARQGYVNTTIRGVAAAAGVAPDLVRRYYANREELFAAAMRLPADPPQRLPSCSRRESTASPSDWSG